jgi:hypothetical protein
VRDAGRLVAFLMFFCRRSRLMMFVLTSRKRTRDRCANERVDSAFVTESHFAFLRMDVYVNDSWVDVNKYQEKRLRAAFERVFVSIEYRFPQRSRLDKPPVYEKVLLAVSSARVTGPTEQSIDSTDLV